FFGSRTTALWRLFRASLASPVLSWARPSSSHRTGSSGDSLVAFSKACLDWLCLSINLYTWPRLYQMSAEDELIPAAFCRLSLASSYLPKAAKMLPRLDQAAESSGLRETISLKHCRAPELLPVAARASPFPIRLSVSLGSLLRALSKREMDWTYSPWAQRMFPSPL